jgi:hypothetical protein
MGEMRDASKILFAKPEGKRPLGRLRRRWEDIRMGFRKIVLNGVDCILMTYDRDQWSALMNAVMNLRVP